MTIEGPVLRTLREMTKSRERWDELYMFYVGASQCIKGAMIACAYVR